MTGSEWDDYAAEWDDDEAARAYSRAAFESLQPAAAEHHLLLDGARVCDFGCGTGLLTERLVGTGAQVDAVDTSPAMLAVLDTKVERRGWTTVHTMSELPAAGPRYDLVVCSSVCGFLEDYPETVAELVSLLVPGGLFVQWDWEADPSADEPHGLTRVAITDALAAAGLEFVTVDVGFRAEVGGETMAPLMGVGRRTGVQR